MADLTCEHGTQIGLRCRRCGGGVVGGNGPERIEPDQVWRARGPTHEMIAVLEVGPEGVLYSVGDERKDMELQRFRDESWCRICARFGAMQQRPLPALRESVWERFRLKDFLCEVFESWIGVYTRFEDDDAKSKTGRLRPAPTRRREV